MKAVKSLAIGAVGLVALVGASAPAAAQYYPGYNYPGNVVGQILQSVVNPYGYNQYGYNQYGNNQYGYGYGANQQVAVNQCMAAVQQRLQYNNGYSAYNRGYASARVLGITRVEQRSRSTVRVRGTATSGMVAPYYPGDVYNGYGGYGYGSYGAYGGYGNAQPADLKFKCDVDYRGYVRDVDIDRRY